MATGEDYVIPRYQESLANNANQDQVGGKGGVGRGEMYLEELDVFIGEFFLRRIHLVALRNGLKMTVVGRSTAQLTPSLPKKGRQPPPPPPPPPPLITEVYPPLKKQTRQNAKRRAIQK